MFSILVIEIEMADADLFSRRPGVRQRFQVTECGAEFGAGYRG